MQVSDLYIVVRELQQIATLQSNLASLLAASPDMRSAYDAQKQAEQQLNEIVEDYGKYNI
jgi:hypothetical protein